MNKWKEKLGCEVNVCQAKQCDEERMKICSLRKAYQERVAYLILQVKSTKSEKIKNEIRKILEGMGAQVDE